MAFEACITIDILLLGDSITFGVVNGDSDDREQTGGYRTVLFRELVANGLTDPTDFDFVGSSEISNELKLSLATR